MKRRLVILLLGSWAVLCLLSCGGSPTKKTNSGLKERLLASQGVTASFSFGSLNFINGLNDTIARVSPLSAGSSPGLMAMSPTRNIVVALDGATNTVYAFNTVTESGTGSVRLAGSTKSMVIPSASAIGYAAVPSATINGFNVLGAVQVMNFSSGSTSLMAVTNAQTVVSNANGTTLLVFSNDSNSVTILTPDVAIPPVDTSCLTSPGNSVCSIVPGFDRPVSAFISGTTAYILNCGAECGGAQASIQTLDLGTLAVGTPLPVNGATVGYLSGSTLYVAGRGTPTGPLCSSIPSAGTTAATFCGTLDVVDLGSMTDPYFNNPSTEIAIPDGYHDRIDLTTNGQIFVGSHDCTNIGDVNNQSGEVRGCLAIYNIAKGTVVIPPDNGNVNGLQNLTTRNIEYVAEGGALRVYDLNKDILLINTFVPQGTINIPGYIGDVKAIDFF